MAKLTLTDITSGYSSASVQNANNAATAAALENTLSRDGTTPNTMSANLDLNSNRVVNVADATNNQDAVTLAQLNAASVVASTIAGTAVTIADAGGYFAGTTAESVLQEVGVALGIGALYPTSADESTASATVVNTLYPWKHVYRYGTNTTPGTTDMSTAFQAAINVAEVSGGLVLVPEGNIRVDSVLTIDSDGVLVVGQGGHTGQTTITCGNTAGPVFRIKNRSCGLLGMRITSTAGRYAASVTDGHGVHVEADDVVLASGSSLSRNKFYDLDIRIQPDDGFHNAGGAELIDFNMVTCSDCKGHGAVFDDGTISSRSNLDLGPFNFELRNFRAIENGGNGLILGNQCANGTLTNCEGLSNCWDSGTRVSLYQFDTTCRSLVVNQPDWEDQLYAQTATNATSSTRTALSVPGKGIIIRTAGAEIRNPHGSSLLTLVDLAASVDDVAVLDPVTFAGTYGADKALTITGITEASPGVVTYTGTDPANGDNFYISGVSGMTEINAARVQVANVNTGANTFEMVDPYSGINFDTSSGYTTYTSGGTLTLVMSDAVITANSNENFRYRGVTTLNTGSGNLLKNLSRDADIWIDDKHYKGTLVSTSDWEIGSRGQSDTVGSGTLTVTGDKILVTGEGDTTDSIGTLRYAVGINGYNGLSCTLFNDKAYTLTLTHNTTMFFRNGLSYALGPDQSIRFEYDESIARWVESGGHVAPTGTYTRAATIVADRALLASASATATNNNNVLAALIADLQTRGIIG